MKKQSTYNSNAKQLHIHFNERVYPNMKELVDDFISEHPDPEMIDDFDNLANALMLAGLTIKTRIKSNPVSSNYRSRNKEISPDLEKSKEDEGFTFIKFR